jgi:uncharacterized NAD(P)/FAD-binding protein YdhS
VSARIGVIGGGAAGTLAAVHLLREGAEGTEVVLIDRDGEFGPGVAYGTRDPLHLLNVPASRMGGISGEPDHFHRWLGERGIQAGPEAFMPRRLFGEYLRQLLDEAEAEASGRCRLRRLFGEATGLTEIAGAGAPLQLELAGGDRLALDRAVLAVGMPPGGDPVSVTEEMRAAGLYVSDPWAPGALDAARRDDLVLIVGTGLTMVDVALTLQRAGHGPSLRAVSRNGLVPRRHREAMTTLRPFPVPLDGGGLESVVAAVLEQIGSAGQRGGDWRDVFDSMRSSTPSLSAAEPEARLEAA